MTFVGRDHEFQTLRDEFDAMRAGHPRVVLVEGQAGIGKTTLLERFLTTVEDTHLLRASGDEFEVDVVFGVVEQLLRPERASFESHVEAGGRLLDRLGHEQPVVLLVDDAHWADTDSLKALQFAVRRLVDDRVLVLVATRDSELLPEGLRKLAGTRVALAPLAATELRALAAGVGMPISLSGARRLHEHSGGSPLHARELLAELSVSAFEEGRARLPAPRGFAALVARRLRTADGETVRLLEAASVLGMRAPLAAAAALGDVDDPLAALETPLELVELIDTELRFVHPLVRAGVYQQLSPARRARLHVRAAAAAEDVAVQLGHLVAASPGTDAALAARLEADADEAATRREWPRMLNGLTAASRLSDNRADRERRMLGAIEAAMYAGDAARARRLAAGTREFVVGPRLDAALAYVAIGAGERDEAATRLQRAWEASEDQLVAERRAYLSILELKPAEAVEWARRAGERGRNWLALGLHWAGRTEEAFAVVDAFASIAGSMLLADDQLDAARAILATSSSDSLVVTARTLARYAQVEFAAGHWDEAAVHADRALVFATESDDVSALALALWAAVLVPSARGEERTSLIRALETVPAVFPAHVAEARIGLATVLAEPEAVLAALEPLTGFAEGVLHPGHVPWAALYAEALVAVGRLDEADTFLAAHEPLATPSMAARLARVRAEWVIAHGGEPVFLPLDGMPYEQALTDLAHGRYLRRAGQRRAAAERLEAARAVFSELGAAPVLERAVRELDACGLTPIKRDADVDRSRLTPQEQLVARLAASGMSNREVAGELLLSVKTVERHLTHIYRKLGVDSRTDLADALTAGWRSR